MIIAIDGPAGSGKSTTSRAVARRLGYFYLDTGAMYRAVALFFIREGLQPTEEAAQNALGRLDMDLRSGSDGLRVLLSGEDVSDQIRGPEVTAMSSRVSQLSAVRSHMVSEQRRLAGIEVGRGRGVVLEGRDIGTVVFPEADLKIFLTADLDERARRRAMQVAAPESGVIRSEMESRDRNDSTRASSPLRKAPGAVEIDTTDLDFQEQVSRIVSLAGERKRNRVVRG